MNKNFYRSTPVYLAFLCMGFGDVVGPLTSQLQTEFELSNFIAGFVTFMGFIMFGLLSVPLGIYQDRKGKKHVLLLGLVAALLGLVLPIVGHYSSFFLLLTSLLLLGTGATLMQVAGNPIMRDVSPEGKFSRNLSFGQFVKAIGSLSGALIPIIAFKFWGMNWRLLFPVYSVIIAITLVYLYIVKIEERKDEKSNPATFSSCFRLLGNPFIALMVLGIFLYVGAEVSMSSKLPNYLSNRFHFDIHELGLFGTLFFFLALMAGRFLGGVVLNWLSPRRFLVITAILSLVGIGGLFLSNDQYLGFVSIAVIGLGFANIFPLIFSISIDTMPQRSNEISGLMITAIIGGAIVPLIFGFIADKFNLMAGFLVPAICILYILYISLNRTIKPA
jgi:MFS transporter, FHS family, L-fucose permease